MKNFENRLRAIKKIADGKTARVAFIDYKNGKHYLDGKPVDINNIKANVIIIDDIPDTPPEFLEKGSDEEWQEEEYQTNE